MGPLEIRAMIYQAAMNRRDQLDRVSSAVLKLEMMGLTPYNGMVECPPPDGIDPFRWKAMLIQEWNNK
jgi:hypothetical protein